MNLKNFISSPKEAVYALLGTILADGHIAKKRRGYFNKSYIEITHTSKNLDYLREIKDFIESTLGIQCSIREHNKKTEEKTYLLFRLSTESCRLFAKIREYLYKDGIKTFPKELMNRLTELSLFLMYLDDGTFKATFYPGTGNLREARIYLCLDSFTIIEINNFRKVLKDKFGIETGYYRHSKNMSENRGFRISINTENTKKFMKIIDKFYGIIPSMDYKFLRYYLL